MTTLEERLSRNRGIGPGFDLLRIALAVSVVAWHVDPLLSGNGTLDSAPFAWFPGYAILAMFFALSGFLIAGSASRLGLADFLLNRGLRILPALFVEVTLSALLLGPLATSYSVKDYFTSLETWHYMTNVVGRINYALPGVFTDHPTSFVNLSLWTIPYEYGCYLIISALILFRVMRRPGLAAAISAGFIAFSLLLLVTGQWSESAGILGKIVLRLFLGHQSRLFASFLLGITIYLFRGKVPYSHLLATGCVLVCCAVMCLGPFGALEYPTLNLLVGPPLVYLTIYLGVSDLPNFSLLRKGDYSYGIYLYGFPIQQIIYEVWPLKDAGIQFFGALAAISLFAAFSWHFIEKPILRLRKRFSFVSRVRLTSDDDAPVLRVITAATGGSD